MKTWPTLPFSLNRIKQIIGCHMLSNTACAENSELIMSVFGFMQFDFIICGFLCNFQSKSQLSCVLCTCMREILETIQKCKHANYPVLVTIWTCFIKMKCVVLNCWIDFLFMNVQRRTLSRRPAALSYIHTCMELSHSVVESVKPECRFFLKVYVDGDFEVHQKSKQGQFDLGVHWLACLCVKNSFIRWNHCEKLFLFLSVTSPTSPLMKAWNQVHKRKHREEVSRDVMMDLADILHKNFSKKINACLFVLFRNAYCAFLVNDFLSVDTLSNINIAAWRSLTLQQNVHSGGPREDLAPEDECCFIV